MKNIEDLNNIYFAINELAAISRLLKNENSNKYYAHCNEIDSIVDRARKSYENLRNLCK